MTDKPKANEAKSSETSAKDEKKSTKAKSASGAISEKLQKIIDQVETLSVLELANLVKALEDKFGVSAAPVAVATGASLAMTGNETAQQEEKTEFDVVLADAGANKIGVIKAVRELKPDLGLKEAKDLVDSTPKKLLESAKKEDAEQAKKKLEEAGAQVELK